MRLGFLASRRRIVGIVATIAALAALIFLAAALSAPSRTARRTPEPSTPALQAEQLATRADEAASNADTTTAADLARQALQLDPANQTARKVLDRVSPSSGGGGASTDQPPTESPGDPNDPGTTPDPDPVTTTTVSAGIYAKPVSKTSALLPSAFGDWSVGNPVVGGGQAVGTYEPKVGSADSRRIVRAAVYAIDAGSSKAATQYLTGVNARAYPQDEAVVSAGIIRTARFATDGTRSAVVAFARGRYVFEVILTVRPATDPETVKQIAVDLAGALPAAR